MEKISVPHYREYLKRELQSRVRRNSGYSLRAFARDLEIQVSKLSEVLHGKRGLSLKTAEKISKKLRLSTDETEIFLNLIGLHQTRSRSLKKQAEEKLKIIQKKYTYEDLGLEQFKVISDWYHFAILELTELPFFESDPRWIAGRLGISSETAVQAIERLLDFGLLKKTKRGTLVQTQINLATPSGTPSQALREHHSQVLMKADAALNEVGVGERDFSTITLAFDSSQMEEVVSEIKSFRRRLGKDIQTRQEKDRVYCLAIQFFPLDQASKTAAAVAKGEPHES